MDTVSKIATVIEMIDDAISLEDWGTVEDAKKELTFLYEEIESDYPLDDFDED